MVAIVIKTTGNVLPSSMAVKNVNVKKDMKAACANVSMEHQYSRSGI